MSKLILGRYTRSGLWTLFLMCALPLHAWTMILAFRDLSWVTERTNAWDAVGVMSYGLVFALFESILFFLAAGLLGFLVSACWRPDQRVHLMSAFAVILSFWAVVTQLFFILKVRLPEWLIAFLARSGHPLWIIYPVATGLVAATFLLAAWAILRSGRGGKLVGELVGRLALLATFYLAFDAAAVVIVAIRNI